MCDLVDVNHFLWRKCLWSLSYIGCFHCCMLVYSSRCIRCRTPALCWCIWIIYAIPWLYKHLVCTLMFLGQVWVATCNRNALSYAKMVFCSVFVGSHIEFQVRTNCACRGTAPSLLGFRLELGCGTTRSCKIAFYPGIVGIWHSMVLSFFSPNCFVTSLGVLLNLLVLNLRRVSKSVSYIGCFHCCMLVYSSWWIRCKTPALC
jgi:hypothetical protein